LGFLNHLPDDRIASKHADRLPPRIRGGLTLVGSAVHQHRHLPFQPGNASFNGVLSHGIIRQAAGIGNQLCRKRQTISTCTMRSSSKIS
jgi:hypothetical protein